MNIFKTFILIINASILTSYAGVYITRDLQVGIGIVTESEKTIHFSSLQIIAAIPKNNLLWYDSDPSIDTFLKAAEKAESQNQNIFVVRKLYESSMREEIATAIAAKKALDAYDQKIKAKIEAKRKEETLSAMDTPTTTSVRIPDNRYATVNINFDNTDFAGFINYQTSVISNGKVFTFNIPQPIFTRTSVNTSVHVSTSGGAGMTGGNQ